ncbi:MAG: c-type cytochrome [Candidatus Poribacteria bacterium]|nr:c-type cytochrome [Candidatus Poribacteria bacterium]
MHRKLFIFGLTILFIGVIIAISIQSVESQNDMVERGKYLVDAVAACGYCHTPRVRAEYNMNMYLAGHPAGESIPRYNFRMIQQGIFMLTAPQLTAFSAPFGTSFASNLTPDNETGLGEWTEKMFIDAMRTGRHQGNPNNREILPPMPIKHYAQMSDADLKAIWAYLRTIKPVKNEVNPALDHQGRPQ